MNSALMVGSGRPGEETKAVQSSSASSSVVGHYGVEGMRSVPAQEQLVLGRGKRSLQSWGGKGSAYSHNIQANHFFVRMFICRCLFSFLNFLKFLSPGIPVFDFLIFAYLIYLSFFEFVNRAIIYVKYFSIVELLRTFHKSAPVL